VDNHPQSNNDNNPVILSQLPMFWFALGIAMTILSSGFVAYRWHSPHSFSPLFDPVVGVRERLASDYSQPLCPPTLFGGFLLLQGVFVAALVVGVIWLSTPRTTSNIEYCFVGILLTGTSIVIFVSTASALLEVLNCTQVFLAGTYVVLTCSYVDFGAKTNDAAALGCGIVMLLLVPAYVAVHVVKEPGMSGGAASRLLAGDEHPYSDFKTNHGPPPSDNSGDQFKISV